jgi:hypothetical protein
MPRRAGSNRRPGSIRTKVEWRDGELTRHFERRTGYCTHLIGASRDRHHCVLAGLSVYARVQNRREPR